MNTTTQLLRHWNGIMTAMMTVRFFNIYVCIALFFLFQFFCYALDVVRLLQISFVMSSTFVRIVVKTVINWRMLFALTTDGAEQFNHPHQVSPSSSLLHLFIFSLALPRVIFLSQLFALWLSSGTANCASATFSNNFLRIIMVLYKRYLIIVILILSTSFKSQLYINLHV